MRERNKLRLLGRASPDLWTLHSMRTRAKISVKIMRNNLPHLDRVQYKFDSNGVKEQVSTD